MVYGCGNNFVKYSVIFVNVLVSIVGIAILATSLALVFSSDFKNYFGNVITQAGGEGSEFTSLQAVFYVTAAIGGLIFLTGFLGCCGAACESTCLLGVFFTIVLLLFLAELGIGIAALVMQNSLESSLTTYYSGTVITQYITDCKTNPTSPLTESWFNTETALQCCGCNNITDYAKYTPASPANINCPSNPCPLDPQGKPYTDGCCTKLWSTLQGNIAIVAGVAIGLLVIELLAMIFSCCLCSAIKKRYHNYA